MTAKKRQKRSDRFVWREGEVEVLPPTPEAMLADARARLEVVKAEGRSAKVIARYEAEAVRWQAIVDGTRAISAANCAAMLAAMLIVMAATPPR